jgi:predicted nucleotidyltransferase
MVLQQNLRIDAEAIADFCRRNHIQKLSLFGSVLTDRFRPDSDVDVLVEFEPGQTPGFGFVRVENELSDLLGRKVDLGTPASLSRHIKEKVLASSTVIYGD